MQFHRWTSQGHHEGWMKVPQWRALVRATTGRDIGNTTAYRWFRAEKAAFERDPLFDGLDGAPIPWRTRPSLSDLEDGYKTMKASRQMAEAGFNVCATLCWKGTESIVNETSACTADKGPSEVGLKRRRASDKCGDEGALVERHKHDDGSMVPSGEKALLSHLWLGQQQRVAKEFLAQQQQQRHAQAMPPSDSLIRGALDDGLLAI